MCSVFLRGSHAPQGRVRLNFTTGAVRASQSIATVRIWKGTFPNDNTVQYGMMGKVVIKRSMLDPSITYAQFAVLSVNMKPGIMLGTLEDFRLCRLLSRWLTSKGQDLEDSRGQRASNDTDALGT